MRKLFLPPRKKATPSFECHAVHLLFVKGGNVDEVRRFVAAYLVPCFCDLCVDFFTFLDFIRIRSTLLSTLR